MINNISIKLFDDGKCPICHSAPQVNKTYPACGHVFCYQCLEDWSQHGRKCPVCKTEFSEIIHTDPISERPLKRKLKSFFKNAGIVLFGVTATIVIIIPFSLVISPILVGWSVLESDSNRMRQRISRFQNLVDSHIERVIGWEWEKETCEFIIMYAHYICNIIYNYQSDWRPVIMKWKRMKHLEIEIINAHT